MVVGSDGTPSSLYTVSRAAGVANAAEARLTVISAYNPGDGGGTAETGAGARQELHGEEAARRALSASVAQLTSDKRVKTIDQRIVEGDPAKALLATAGSNPANLIVVGNRGLGAEEGQLLGSVPREVVKSAVCDVMIVQTSESDEKT